MDTSLLISATVARLVDRVFRGQPLLKTKRARAKRMYPPVLNTNQVLCQDLDRSDTIRAGINALSSRGPQTVQTLHPLQCGACNKNATELSDADSVKETIG